MKRLVLLNWLLFAFFISTFNNASTTENRIVETKALLSFKGSDFFSEQYCSQEGFCANTLIQTPFEHKTIKSIAQDDIIIDCNGETKKIIAVTKQYVNRYIKLIVDNVTICTGCNQLYYTYPKHMWVTAQDIKAGDMLLNNTNTPSLVTHTELISEDILLYYLTVEDHIFCIIPYGLYVHNSEALLLGISGTSLSYIATINPILATIGVGFALSTIAHKAYQAYKEQHPENDKQTTLPTSVTLAERSYYIQRSTALETLKKELLCIKNGLENIKAICGGPVDFTCQFLKQTNDQSIYNQNPLLKISAKSEENLPESQKKNLRILREADLEYLEQEIIFLQTILAFHVNELIEQVYEAENEYIKAQNDIGGLTALWNNNRNRMTESIALQSYKADLLAEHLLNNLNQKVDELKMVAHYYRSYSNTMCISQSTNIIDCLKKIDPIIVEYGQQIAKERTCIIQHIGVSEQYFARYRIAIGHIKNETKNYLEKGRHDRNAQTTAKAKNKLKNTIDSNKSNKPPKKDDNDNKNKGEERIINTMTKTEFFKKVKDLYEFWQNGIYKRKKGSEGIENAEYLKWDNLHNDVEAYSAGRKHLGSIDPHTLKLYKDPISYRKPFQ